MGNYRLKELLNLEKEEQQVIKQVLVKIHHKNKVKKYFNTMLFTIVFVAMFILIFNVINNNQSSKNAVLLDNLTEVKGDGVSYSELFNGIDKQNERTLKYYKPISFNKFSKLINIKMPENNLGLEKLKDEVILVKSEKGVEIQFLFEKLNEYNFTDEFLSISISESDVNPFDVYDYANDTKDIFGNKIEKETLTETVYFVHNIMTTNSGNVFNYYYFDEDTKKIGLIGTRANEIYTYYEGNIYRIGYTLNQPKEEIVGFVKQFILQNSSTFNTKF